MTDGVAKIVFANEVEQIAAKILGRNACEEACGMREHDVLSQCLGPEQPGHVCGVSSYHS